MSFLLRSSARQTKSFFRAFSTAGDSKTFELARPFKGHLLESLPSTSVTTDKAQMLDFYRQMVFYRWIESVCDTLYKKRAIRGFCHLYDGQEAVLVGMESVLKRTDSVITSYRDHCHQIARGDTPESMLAELLGKKTGCSKGRGGSMHMYYPKGKFYGGNGIVGAQVPLGAGLAFAHKYRNDGGVAVAAYGDGAANQGQLFEAANMAALWKLPLIFLCENNEYGMGTATHRGSADKNFYQRGAYIPGIWADGMDVLASRAAFEFAVDYARSGNGPIFVEMSTYRYHGHSMSDPGISYRSTEEVATMRRDRDCITGAKNRILEAGWATSEELNKIAKAAKKEIDKAAKVALAADMLEGDELWEDVYSDNSLPYARAVDLANSYVKRA
jgi:pyruvate dehydrogenase E1 component alpha subunit